MAALESTEDLLVPNPNHATIIDDKEEEEEEDEDDDDDDSKE